MLSMTHRLRRFTALFGIAALLLMQLAVSAYACPGGAEPRFEAMSAMAVTGQCDEADVSEAIVCQVHCTQGQQSFDKTQSPGIPSVIAAGFSSIQVPAVGPSNTAAPGLFTRFLAQAPEPPLSIRNCCFRL
jgi:hypothetical protein